jgi:hypothetical protein
MRKSIASRTSAMLSGTVLPASRTHMAISSGVVSSNRTAAFSSALARVSAGVSFQSGWARTAMAMAS